jgi:methionine synthase II (cobalamin-independent)
MKYYLLSNSAKKNEVGTYPQTTGLVDGYEEFAENSMVNLNSDEFPNFIPDLRFELDEDAILTDIISPSNLDYAKGLMMNEKAKKIFERFNLIPHKFYEASIKVNNSKFTYYWMHTIPPALDIIDFANSSFLEVLPTQEKIQRIFQNYDEYEKYGDIDLPNDLEVERLILIQSFHSKKIDLFCLPGLFTSFLVSQKLYDKIKETQLTGLHFEEQSFY